MRRKEKKKYVQAERRSVGRDNIPDNKVILYRVGELPRGSEGRTSGYFKHQVYVPEPMRFYKCQRFVHMRARRMYRERCGLCF